MMWLIVALLVVIAALLFWVAWNLEQLVALTSASAQANIQSLNELARRLDQ